uniref:Uncharacterized protein n=1 Tax=Arundo donax TaxID=35708 RepID=A0A0A8ZD49_ARUDO
MMHELHQSLDVHSRSSPFFPAVFLFFSFLPAIQGKRCATV